VIMFLGLYIFDITFQFRTKFNKITALLISVMRQGRKYFER